MARPPQQPQSPAIIEITRWDVRPGDRLIAIVDRDAMISTEQAAELRRRLRVQLSLPDDFPIAIANSEWRFTVINSDGEAYSRET